MIMRKYRFFYHYFKQKKKMSIHFRNKCYIVDNITCKVECETKWSKTQPNIVMRGFCTEIIIDNNSAIII